MIEEDPNDGRVRTMAGAARPPTSHAWQQWRCPKAAMLNLWQWSESNMGNEEGILKVKTNPMMNTSI